MNLSHIRLSVEFQLALEEEVKRVEGSNASGVDDVSVRYFNISI